MWLLLELMCVICGLMEAFGVDHEKIIIVGWFIAAALFNIAGGIITHGRKRDN